MPNRLPGETRAAEHLMPKKAKSKKIDDELWPEIEQRRTLGLTLRRPYEQRWILDLAFLSGRQYVMFNSNAHILQEINRLRGRVRTVDNVLMPRWRRQVADLIKTRPQMSVVPETNEQEDIDAAKLGNKYLRHFWRQNKMKKKIRELAGWIFSVGNGFLDDRWNSWLGPTKLKPNGDLVYLGDADVGVWSPFDILVPGQQMGETDLHSFPWLIKMKFRSLEYIADKYPRGNLVVSERRPSSILGADLIVNNSGISDEKIEGAMLVDLYIQPSGKFKQGAFITGSNGIILQTADYPYDFYNLEHFKELDIPGVFWGQSTLDQKIPQQIRWNRTNNYIDDYNKDVAKGKMLIPKGSRIEYQPDDEHGEQVFYKPVMGHKPDYINQKALPGSFDQALATAHRSIQDAFSQHEITFGTNKSDIRSGDMVGRLREQDAQGAIPSHAVFEESLEAVMQRVLRRVQRGYTEERMIKIVGRDNDYEVFAFKGADLRNNTDVSVKRQSSLPDSRIERELIIERRFERGFYGNPEDPEVRRHVANMLEDAVVENMYEGTRLDEKYARWENRVLANAEAPINLVNAYDNHEIHAREHTHFMKTMDYQRIKVANPRLFMVLEQRFMQHVMQHQAFINQAIEAQIQRQRLIEGGEKNV